MSRPGLLRLLPALIATLAACGGETGRTGAGPDPAVAIPSPPAPSGGATPRSGALAGAAAALCVEEYSPARVATRAFAFDGTVTAIGPGTTNRAGMGGLDTAAVTFDVHEWWSGGSGPTVTVDMGPPGAAGSTRPEQLSAYGVGTRLLLSGEARWGGAPMDDALAWGCGFTRYYDPETAALWRAGH